MITPEKEPELRPVTNRERRGPTRLGCPRCPDSFMLAPSAFADPKLWRCMTCGTLVSGKEGVGDQL